MMPKHHGGTDDPSNLIKVNVALHAFLHKLLWEEDGRWQDKLAYDGLAGLKGKDEIVAEIQRINGLKSRGKVYRSGYTHSEETKKKMSISAKKAAKNRPEDYYKKIHENMTYGHSARTWNITYPDGKIHAIFNIADWCKKMGFPKSSVSCAKKDNRPYKGYLFEKVAV